MRVGAPAEAPWGYTKLCERKSKACHVPATTGQRIALTPMVLKELDELNQFVNLLIKPMSDLEKHKTSEHWELLNCKPGVACFGDCEEYVLLKRQFLIARGWPTSALLITVAYDERGEGHAVLTVATNAGDLILDSKHDEIKWWYELPYRFVSRQSSKDPTVWYSLSKPTVKDGKHRESASVPTSP